jgi:hypothetical protein
MRIKTFFSAVLNWTLRYKISSTEMRSVLHISSLCCLLHLISVQKSSLAAERWSLDVLHRDEMISGWDLLPLCYLFNSFNITIYFSGCLSLHLWMKTEIISSLCRWSLSSSRDHLCSLCWQRWCGCQRDEIKTSLRRKLKSI